MRILSSNKLTPAGLAVALLWWPFALVLALGYWYFVLGHYRGKVQSSVDAAGYN